MRSNSSNTCSLTKGDSYMVILPESRDNFTKHDFEFISNILGKNKKERAHILSLTDDIDCLTILLDDNRVYKSILSSNRDDLVLSMQFYFYVVIRKVFLEIGIEDIEVVDYIASVFTKFCGYDKEKFITISEMMNQKAKISNDYDMFLLNMNLGNYALFVSSLFESFIHNLYEEGLSPDVDYYEAMGGVGYLEASNSSFAQEYGLVSVFEILGKKFKLIRESLSNISY